MWDYIIIGAGSAGCVLANRLSADPGSKVLLVEAGGAADRLRFKIPALGPLKAVGQADSDWMFRTEPDPSRLDRVDIWPRGKVVGGSSALNGTIYVRGNRGDYDHWAQLGNRGWDYDSLLPFFNLMERADARLDGYGHDGAISIEQTRGAHPLAQTFIEAMAELGVPANPRYNGEEQAGSAITHVTQRRGWRWSAARGYLDPIARRSNLKILKGAFARRIIFEGRRAVGIEIERHGQRFVERCAGEVIISASAFNSPKLLMLSGIGDPDHLAGHGIPIIQANPSVGQNLQEHAAVTVKAYVNVRTSNMDLNLLGQLRHGGRFGLFGSGPASYIFPAVSFVKLRPESEYPDLQFHFGAFARDMTPQGPRMLDRPAITLQPSVNRSQSRGYVQLRSADPFDQPVIQPMMLNSRYDVETLIAGVRLARRALHSRAFAPFFQGEHAPGTGVQTDDEIETYVRGTAAPCFHPCGTVKMGTDANAVVDPELKVIGVERLRVIDSSIIPQVPSGNINAISMVIGEKGADLVLGRKRP